MKPGDIIFIKDFIPVSVISNELGMILSVDVNGDRITIITSDGELEVRSVRYYHLFYRVIK